MELIIGLLIWVIGHICFLKKLEKLEIDECPYDTTYCTDVRAIDSRISDDIQLEQKRYRVNKKNSKF